MPSLKEITDHAEDEDNKRKLEAGKEHQEATESASQQSAIDVESVDIEMLAQALSEFDDALRGIMNFDHSISAPELGSLFDYAPELVIGKMQRVVMEVYGAPFAWISPNGTTAANVLAMLATTRPGETIILQRDSHISQLSGVITLGLQPCYLEPTYDEEWGINVGVSAAQLNAKLAEHPHATAVFLTTPNYFGFVSDLQGCVEVAERYNIPVVVDNAHGTHFGHHPALPASALASGAAIVTQSTHKTCGALSQGSQILFNHPDKYRPAFYRAVNNSGLISTSFSFPIVASVARAAVQLREEGETRLGRAIAAANATRDALSELPNLRCLDGRQRTPWCVGFDPLRVTVDVSKMGRDGYDVEDMLICRFGIYPEMATRQHVLFLFTMAHGPAEGERVVQAMRTLALEYQGNFPKLSLPTPPIPAQNMLPSTANFAPRKRLLVEEAVGLVSAETIACYPPGSAIVVMGEMLSYEVISYLQEARECGAKLKGASDANFRTIEVVDI